MRSFVGQMCDCGNPATRTVNNSDFSCERCWRIDNCQSKAARRKHRGIVVESPVSRRGSYAPVIYPEPFQS